MAVVFEEALKKNLDGGKYLPVYILFGEDSYLKSNYLNKISGGIAEEDDVFNFAKFQNGCDLQDVYNAVMQMPVMAEKKCVVLNDFDYLHCDPSQLERLVTLIGEVPLETTFILYFDGIETDHKKGAKFKKLIAACEKNGGMTVALNHRSRAELVKMLCNGAEKRGCKMSSAVGNYLVETAGDDINFLRLELIKLCAFAGQDVITKEHIDEVCTVSVEANIFKLSDFLLAQNSTEALKMLDKLFFLRTEPMSIFYTIAGVYTDMYRVYCAKNAGVSLNEVAKSFGYKGKEFLLEKASRNLSKFDSNKLSLSLQTLVKTDGLLKSFGSQPRQILEELIVRLIYIISKGEDLD